MADHGKGKPGPKPEPEEEEATKEEGERERHESQQPDTKPEVLAPPNPNLPKYRLGR